MPPRARPLDAAPVGAPRYWDQAAVARRFDLDRHELAALLVRWPHYPAPAAYVGDAPVWLTTTGRAWDRWRARQANPDRPELPRYVSAAEIARHCGVTRAAVGNWLARWPDAVPRPDATVDDGRPLWLEARIPEWQRWARANATGAGGWRG